MRDAEIRFAPLRDACPEGLGGLDIHVTDRARALANTEAAACRSGDDLVAIYGMRLRSGSLMEERQALPTSMSG